MESAKNETSFEAFSALDLRCGVVVTAELNPKASPPAYILGVDFGPLGVFTSSARITALYHPEQLIGIQVVALVNVGSRNVAGVTSQCLVLGAVEPNGQVVLLTPDRPVNPGAAVS